MVRLAANLSTMYNEVGYLDRFAAAAGHGFKAVEFMFPYEAEPEEVAAKAAAAGVDVVLFNFPAGDWGGGERGLAALPDRMEECQTGVDKAVRYARALSCPRLHMMAGLVPDADRKSRHEDVYVENVRHAADKVAGDGIDVLIEPINTRVDIPGYYLDGSDRAKALIEKIDRPNVKMMFDIYHMQIMEGDLARRIEALLPVIGHLQLADNPGRGEPGTGEIDYPWLFGRIDAIGYDGWIGCEYKPVAGTAEGLGWAAPYL